MGVKASWRRTFVDLRLCGWLIALAYGPGFQWWFQPQQGDGGAMGIGWLTLVWRCCTCDRPNWYYCSFHRKERR